MAARARTSAFDIQRKAQTFLVDQLSRLGLEAETLPGGDPSLLIVSDRGGRRSLVVRILPAAGPHRRGGRGSLGLHWMLRSDIEDYAALVDLSRRRAWLLPAAEFRSRAQPLPGGRFHLDWLVVPLGRPRSRPPPEHEFDEYLLEAAACRFLKQEPPEKEESP